MSSRCGAQKMRPQSSGISRTDAHRLDRSISSFIVFLSLGAMLLLVVSIASPVAAAAASGIFIAQNAAGAANGADCADAYAYAFFNNSANWGSGANQIGPGTTIHLCGTFSMSAGAS